ncbi:MAG: replication protein RepA [Shewanella sp.]|nr:replication protein RepA [Shewanella sp.]MCF1431797.1 replication protein RepA [Shewanella sp.]MCF1440036.1 replication protein RepA [Shewanella sp.]MCF1456831.1 replication protein RepA [Shewanella sp.]
MGLADLKKNALPAKPSQAQLSLEEFIDGATQYAMGLERNAGKPAGNGKHRSGKFRNATFSLSEACIKQLAEITGDGHIAKSRLVRILINEHYQQTQQMREQIEAASLTE